MSIRQILQETCTRRSSATYKSATYTYHLDLCSSSTNSGHNLIAVHLLLHGSNPYCTRLVSALIAACCFSPTIPFSILPRSSSLTILPMLPWASPRSPPSCLVLALMVLPSLSQPPHLLMPTLFSRKLPSARKISLSNPMSLMSPLVPFFIPLKSVFPFSLCH